MSAICVRRLWKKPKLLPLQEEVCGEMWRWTGEDTDVLAEEEGGRGRRFGKEAQTERLLD